VSPLDLVSMPPKSGKNPWARILKTDRLHRSCRCSIIDRQHREL